ncbi:MAG: leucine-rich repeat domain-containing protein [Ruminococcus sp.]|nr:leucine-rich repeat domain-containing protein [Ruminococcus sp.]
MGFEIKNGVLVKYIDNGRKDIVIPDNVTHIASSAFRDCKSIVSVTITENVRKIGERAFQGCSELNSLVFRNGSVFIGSFAFYQCKKIVSVTIPADFVGTDKFVFLCCTRFEYLKIKGENVNITLHSAEFLTDNIYPQGGAGEFVDFICAEDYKKEKLFAKIKVMSYKIPCVLICAFEYGDETAKAYIKDNVEAIVNALTRIEDAENLTKILSFGYVTAENIDKLIQYTIDRKNAEFQLILSNYKNEHLGFADNLDNLDSLMID